LSWFDFGFGWGTVGAGAGSGGGTPSVPEALGVPNCIELNPGGETDSQYLTTAASFKTGTGDYTIGMWQYSPTNSGGTIACMAGDEDRAPLTIANGGAQANAGGAEDGSRHFFAGGASGFSTFIYHKTNFNELPAPETFSTSYTAAAGTSWQLLVWTVTATSIKLYRFVNAAGFQLAETHVNAGGAPSNTTAPLTIGAFRRSEAPDPVIFGSPGYVSYRRCRIHSAFVYDGLLDIADINTLWNPTAAPSGYNPVPTDPLTVPPISGTLRACWTFADTGQTYGNGNTITDRSGNGHDLTMVSDSVAWGGLNEVIDAP